ncbi:unnamed protein product [Leptidea sinapis]|uniref:Uncharacterized protein n=1 Tax=Leptidea sinapis TaxID=189913 RepID=A0A5E4Q0M1_9NEOP|nr:unnamed protein product [Leptidea sinapis]
MKFVINGDEESGSVGHLVQELKVDANIDLSADEEYEDLRAEFLAYREALTNLKSRRTGRATCWARGGVCVHIRQCPSFTFVIGVYGCNQRFHVCCKNFKPLPPTVGLQRFFHNPAVDSDESKVSAEEDNDLVTVLLMRY